MLIDGQLEESKLFKEFERIQKEGLEHNQKQFDAAWAKIQEKEAIYGDVGLSGQRDDIGASHLMTKNAINSKYEKQVSLYKKACSIQIEESSLLCSLTVPMPYGLTSEEQSTILNQHSSQRYPAEVVVLAEKKFILFNAKLNIPSKFEGNTPAENKEFADWIMDCLRANALFAVLVATEWASELNYEIA